MNGFRPETQYGNAARQDNPSSELSRYCKKRRPHRKKKYVPALVAGAIVLLFAVLYFVNGARVELVLEPEPDGVTEIPYGGEYTPPSAKAVFKGRLLFRDGKAVEPELIGSVDTSKLGEQTLVWKADHLWFSAEKEIKVSVKDVTPPVVILVPDEREFVYEGREYEDPGFTATDDVDGDLTNRVVSTLTDEGVTYEVEDSSGNKASVIRPLNFKEDDPPVITLSGDTLMTLTAGKDAYTEAGYSASDDVDGDITEKVSVEGEVDSATPGVYRLIYRVQDSSGKTAETVRTVVAVSADETATDENGKYIYLTFDDGPGKYTEELLEILAKYKVKATFFVTSLGDHSLIAREKEEGHSVGVHTYSHRYDIIYESDEAFLEDLAKINEIVKEQTGDYTYLMRFPGGSSNTISHENEGIMTRLTQKVLEMGYQYFDWNVDSGDAVTKPKSEDIRDNIIKGCTDRKNSVVLMHDTKQETVEAIEEVIVWGLENGYKFLPLKMTSPAAHHRIFN